MVGRHLGGEDEKEKEHWMHEMDESMKFVFLRKIIPMIGRHLGALPHPWSSLHCPSSASGAESFRALYMGREKLHRLQGCKKLTMRKGLDIGQA